jgi:ComF family protein
MRFKSTARATKRFTGFTKPSARPLLDWLLPPRCPVTGQLVTENGTVDPAFWKQLSFIEKPFCACCGDPFPTDTAEDFLCTPCLTEKPEFKSARAALRYDDVSAPMILKLKYADSTILAPIFAVWLHRAGEEILRGADYLIPVPLHRMRLLKRRYNQAALISDALAKRSGVPHLPDILIRTRATESQGTKSKSQRHDNVKNAFTVPESKNKWIKGATLVVVDDVFTSGATAAACTQALLDAGAKEVRVLCVARVTRAI